MLEVMALFTLFIGLAVGFILGKYLYSNHKKDIQMAGEKT